MRSRSYSPVAVHLGEDLKAQPLESLRFNQTQNFFSHQLENRRHTTKLDAGKLLAEANGPYYHSHSPARSKAGQQIVHHPYPPPLRQSRF